MTVSVIVPSFNQGRFLAAAIDSITKQRDEAIEIVVIDGGSTDNSRAVLEQHADVLAYWCSEKDRGQSHAFNKGYERTTGEVVGWLNSDDLYLPGALNQALEYFEAHPEIDAVFADYWFIDSEGRPLRERREPAFDPSIYLWTGDCYHANCAAFFRRRFFERAGVLDESLHYGMDYELYLRAARLGLRYGHVRAPWGAYRLHDGSKSVSAHDRQSADATLIVNKYRPSGTGPVEAAVKRAAWKSIRLMRKLFRGAYLSSPSPSPLRQT